MSGFVDEAQINVRGGDGGAGAASFRREAHVARGGPDGGDGGRGGDVWLVASNDQSSLIAFSDHPHRRAGNAKHGAGKRRQGAAGSDVVVKVPVGTVVRAKDSAPLADLSEAGDRWLAARGGRGGRGNARFLSNTRRAPGFAERGEPGEERWLKLELKLCADVALVGFPNAGKSTLISRLSAARPKIADYPFTTLEPHLGVVRFGPTGDEVEYVVADIPGLVEGAAEGRGLGHRFLRHIERARVLVLLLDLAPVDGRSTGEQQRILLSELQMYRPILVERPRLSVGSKSDLVAEPGPSADGVEMCVSSFTGAGLGDLVRRLAQMVTDARQQEEVSGREIVVHRPAGEGVEVTRGEDGSFVVAGRSALRAVSLSDLDDVAMEYVQGRLRRLGVERALVRAGIRDGDVVRLGALEFVYRSDRSVAETASEAARADRVRRRQKTSGR